MNFENTHTHTSIKIKIELNNIKEHQGYTMCSSTDCFVSRLHSFMQAINPTIPLPFLQLQHILHFVWRMNNKALVLLNQLDYTTVISQWIKAFVNCMNIDVKMHLNAQKEIQPDSWKYGK